MNCFPHRPCDNNGQWGRDSPDPSRDGELQCECCSHNWPWSHSQTPGCPCTDANRHTQQCCFWPTHQVILLNICFFTEYCTFWYLWYHTFYCHAHSTAPVMCNSWRMSVQHFQTPSLCTVHDIRNIPQHLASIWNCLMITVSHAAKFQKIAWFTALSYILRYIEKYTVVKRLPGGRGSEVPCCHQ